MFVLLMACKIEMRTGTLSHQSFQTLLKGGAALNMSDCRPKPFQWIPDRAWLNLVALAESVKTFRNLPDFIQRNDQMWKHWWDQESPEHTKIPDIDVSPHHCTMPMPVPVRMRVPVQMLMHAPVPVPARGPCVHASALYTCRRAPVYVPVPVHRRFAYASAC